MYVNSSNGISNELYISMCVSSLLLTVVVSIRCVSAWGIFWHFLQIYT